MVGASNAMTLKDRIAEQDPLEIGMGLLGFGSALNDEQPLSIPECRSGPPLCRLWRRLRLTHAVDKLRMEPGECRQKARVKLQRVSHEAC
jgi:hypothetical protein